MKNWALWDNDSKKLLKILLVSALLGVLAIPFPGLARVVLEQLALFLPLSVLFLEFVLIFLTILVPESFWVINILRVNLPGATMEVKGWAASLCVCTAGTYTGLSVGYGFLYQFSPDPTLLNTCLLSLYCAVWFFFFYVFSSSLNDDFFTDFAKADQKKKKRARIWSAIGLTVTSYAIWAYILY